MFDVGEGGDWVCVSIDVIVVLGAEMCFIVFMLKHCARHNEPTVGVNEIPTIFNGGIHHEEVVSKLVAGSGRMVSTLQVLRLDFAELAQ